MEIVERKMKGVYEIAPSPHSDKRGFFMRTYDTNIFKEAGIEREWVQENHSKSEEKGIVRGLHFQLPPHTETKLVRCIAGAVLDVFVDLRKDSPTFGEWDAIELTEENKKMILIPRGFAHGFCTLTEVSEVLYKVDNFYAPKAEKGLLWNDPELGVEWPIEVGMVSEKDKNNMSLSAFIKEFGSLNV